MINLENIILFFLFIFFCLGKMGISLFILFFPKAAAKGSFEKSVAIKDCHQSSAEVMAVFKDCNQTLPKVLLE